MNNNSVARASRDARLRLARGFSLIELMISVAVFLVVGGAALSLFKQHAGLFTQQQSVAGINISLRNALSMMQMDVVNAGTGYYTTADISSWPTGIIISNNVANSNCFNSGTFTYSATCFDSLSVIAPDQTAFPGHPDNNAGGCVLTNGGSAYLTPVGGTSLATLASSFKLGDQVLFMHNGASNNPLTPPMQMTTAKLSANATNNGTRVVLTFTATNADGSNAAGSTGNDKYGLTTNVDPTLGTLTNQFCPGTDWVVKLNPVTYQVDASNPSDPQLTRSQGGNTVVIADQIIGFKIGASLYNDTSATSGSYNYDASSYKRSASTNCGYCFDLVRSVRISLIGRTPPGSIDNSSNYTNSFDGGRYRIQSASIVVNPRNLSMND